MTIRQSSPPASTLFGEVLSGQVDRHCGVEAVDGVVDAADEAGFGVAAGAAHVFEEGEAECLDLGSV